MWSLFDSSVASKAPAGSQQTAAFHPCPRKPPAGSQQTTAFLPCPRKPPLARRLRLDALLGRFAPCVTFVVSLAEPAAPFSPPVHGHALPNRLRYSLAVLAVFLVPRARCSHAPGHYLQVWKRERSDSPGSGVDHVAEVVPAGLAVGEPDGRVERSGREDSAVLCAVCEGEHFVVARDRDLVFAADVAGPAD
jgi:hypothetical protein